MALKGKYVLPNGNITLDEAYIRVDEIKIDSKSRAAINYFVYQNEEERLNKASIAGRNKVILYGDNYDFYFLDSVLEGQGVTPIKQAYKFLKTLDLFVGFEDI